jgi:hypothetical protein
MNLLISHTLTGDLGEINAYKTMMKNVNRREHLRDLNADGWIILKWIIREIGCERVD